MRLYTTLLIVIFSSALRAQNNSSDTMDINDAVNSKLLQIEIRGYYGQSKFQPIDGSGYYFGKCITITVENIGEFPYVIHMPAGSILKCRDTTVQDMIVTESFSLDVYPTYKEAYLINAMCGEISDKGPQHSNYYDYGGLAEPEVVKIAELVEEKRLFTSLGQFAMWTVRNDATSKKLKQYGATDDDLQEIVDYLFELGIERKLTKEIAATVIIPEEVIQPDVIEPEKNEFQMNTLSWILTGVCSLLVVVLIVVVIRKSKSDSTPKLG